MDTQSTSDADTTVDDADIREIEIRDLELMRVVGFDGTIPGSLKLHPDGIHIIYSLGVKLIVLNWSSGTQRFLEGHTHNVTSIDISASGKYVASGQSNYMIFKAFVCVWDFTTGDLLVKHDSHKVRVESVIFSSCEGFLYSLGGRDDCQIVAFHIPSKTAVCGGSMSAVASGVAKTLRAANTTSSCFLSGGDTHMKIWNLDTAKRMLTDVSVNMGKIRRCITCIEITPNDEFAYCGTTSGDILKVKMNMSCTLGDPQSLPVLMGCYGKLIKKKVSLKLKDVQAEDVTLYSAGVTALHLLKDGKILVGSGMGLVDLVRERDIDVNTLVTKQQTKLTKPSVPMLIQEKCAFTNGGITSIQFNPVNNKVFVATSNCEIFLLDLSSPDFAVTLVTTCHTSAIYDVQFPVNFAAVFATCGRNDIRIWNIRNLNELLRISVPNMVCNCIVFTHDGKALISGWNDGFIRCFTPQSGKLKFLIPNAHNVGVTALAITPKGSRLMSGGNGGQIRIWKLLKDSQTMESVLKEHTSEVTTIQIKTNGKEAMSSSMDGTCAIWDIVRDVRLIIIILPSMVMAAAYHPSGVQLITCSTNKMIDYWETVDGSLIRSLQGSEVAAVNCVDFVEDGRYFVTGGADQIVKLWLYREGLPSHVGIGHAASIKKIKIAPDRSVIVSVGTDGSIFLWRFPEEERDDQSVTSKVSGVSKSSSKTSNISLKLYKMNKKSSSSNLPKNSNSEQIDRISLDHNVQSEIMEDLMAGDGPRKGSTKTKSSAASITSSKSKFSISKSNLSVSSIKANSVRAHVDETSEDRFGDKLS